MTQSTATQPTINLLAAVEELDWLKNNPEFEERPASIEEFLGESYLNIEKGVRPGLRQILVDIFGTESGAHKVALFEEAIFTGAIGIGKTTFASIALPYMAHWALCLRNPQEHLDLLPGSRIALMQMSTSEDQAREVIFGDINARINHSPWFKKFPRDPAFKNQIRFTQKDVWIVPGDSAETTFEGYNILGGIVDEMDSHRITPKKDYAEEGYNTISNRIKSRFGDRGLLILIGQMKKQSGFAMRHYERMKTEPTAYVSRMTIWESFGWDKYLNEDGTRNSFWFDIHRKTEIPALAAEMIENPNFMEIPNLYYKSFVNDPDKALKDLAGIPPVVGNPFIGMVYKLDSARDGWHERYLVDSSPVSPNLSDPQFAPWFFATDTLPRAMHIDIAISAEGDALGMAMGHVREVKEIEGEMKPFIVFDFLLRVRPLPGRQIILSDVRQILYHVRDELKFKVKKVTLDGFQSTDTMQQLMKKRFHSAYLSVDKSLLPYQDFRDAIYEERVEFPKYLTYMRHGSTDLVEIALQEITRLVDEGKKINHPEGGSKDVADAMAGVVHTLMGDRSYRRGVSSVRRSSSDRSLDSPEPDLPRMPLPPNLSGMTVPGYGNARLNGGAGVLQQQGDIYSGTGIQRPLY